MQRHEHASRPTATGRGLLPLLALLALARATGALAAPPPAGELLLVNEGNRMRRIDVDSIGAPQLLSDVLVERASASEQGGGVFPKGKFRDVNGMICPFPDGSGRFVAGEDTRQPSPPPGWGVFSATGKQIGKLVATYFEAQAEPHGCAFAPDGSLFTTEVGFQNFGTANGQLIQWFPPFDAFPGAPGAYPATNAPSTSFCKIASDISTAGGVAVDAQGRVYVASSSGLAVLRFSPPFPTGSDAAHGCGGVDALGSPVATAVQREVLLSGPGLSTFSGLAFAPNGNLYAAHVLTGFIGEYATDGALVRAIVAPPESLPPISTGNPQSLAVGRDGTLYYADLDLVGTLPNVGPGPNGKVRRVRFDANGDPLPPEIVVADLDFPDGVAVIPGDLEPGGDWPTYGGGAARQFFAARETQIDADNVRELAVKWTLPTGAIITGSPSVATVDLPGECCVRVAFFQSWDGFVYAVRVRDGGELWRFATAQRAGVSFPSTASVHVETVDGAPRVLVGSGQTFYALDAVTGTELWRFDAGTGCVVPGACSFTGERNQIESSAVVAEGLVFFGMDVDDREGGKGGFYALDVRDGRLRWFFDLESGATCRPDATDDVRRYDGYHSESELGLPAGFLATRPGCDHPRSPNGCGNVWSSPAYDAKRGYLYFASSNCDTDGNPATLRPAPPMPPYDEAIVALDVDGNPVWRWRPREVDNADLAFGAPPNLFTAVIGGVEREVVGVGNKDGTYYVLDRDGRNELTGLRWNAANPANLPYWRTNVVPGGTAGGILAAAAVDDAGDRIYFGTAPGSFANVLNPQRPTVHALDAGSGAVLWQNVLEPDADATFAPTTALPSVVFTGSVVGGLLRSYDAQTGAKLGAVPVGVALAAAPAVSDGTLLVGGGIGQRTGNPTGSSDQSASIPHDLTALCVPGTPACATDVPIAGQRLYLADSGTVRRLELRAQGDTIAAPASDGPGDPTVAGAALVVRNPASGEEVRLPLPAAGWQSVERAGEPRAARGFRYRDRTRASGPCFDVQVANGRLVAKCGGASGFTLDEPGQGALAVALELGHDRVLCARFGGRIDVDLGRASGRRGRFRAAGAAAPGWCSLR